MSFLSSYSLSIPITRLQQYPPEPHPSQAQINLVLLKRGVVDPAVWEDVSFTEEFFNKYGPAFSHYRIFERSMRAQPNRAVLTKFKNQIDFYDLATTYSFVAFCKASDLKAKKKKMAPLGRMDLEAAWIQELFYKYDVMGLQAVQLKHHVEGDVRGKLQFLLKMAIEKRYTSRGVEKYWAQKQKAFPGYTIDITRLRDDSDEHAVEEKKRSGEFVIGGAFVSEDHGDEIDNDALWGACSDHGDEDTMDVDVDMDGGFGALTLRPKQA